MSRKKTILVLGLLVAVLPFLGFPSGFRNFLFVIFGLAIAGIAFLAIWKGRRFSGKVTDTVYEESRPDGSKIVVEAEESFGVGNGSEEAGGM